MRKIGLLILLFNLSSLFVSGSTQDTLLFVVSKGQGTGSNTIYDVLPEAIDSANVGYHIKIAMDVNQLCEITDPLPIVNIQNDVSLSIYPHENAPTPQGFKLSSLISNGVTIIGNNKLNLYLDELVFDSFDNKTALKTQGVNSPSITNCEFLNSRVGYHSKNDTGTVVVADNEFIIDEHFEYSKSLGIYLEGNYASHTIENNTFIGTSLEGDANNSPSGDFQRGLYYSFQDHESIQRTFKLSGNNFYGLFEGLYFRKTGNDYSNSTIEIEKNKIDSTNRAAVIVNPMVGYTFNENEFDLNKYDLLLLQQSSMFQNGFRLVGSNPYSGYSRENDLNIFNSETLHSIVVQSSSTGFDNEVHIVGLDLGGGVKISGGGPVLVRGNKLKSHQHDVPVILTENGGNHDIPPPNFVEAELDGDSIQFKFTLDNAHSSIDNAYGDYVVDFYVTDETGDKKDFIGESLIVDVNVDTFSTSFLIPSGVVFGDEPTVISSLTSLGNQSNNPLGTSQLIRTTGFCIWGNISISNISCLGGGVCFEFILYSDNINESHVPPAVLNWNLYNVTLDESSQTQSYDLEEVCFNTITEPFEQEFIIELVIEDDRCYFSPLTIPSVSFQIDKCVDVDCDVNCESIFSAPGVSSTPMNEIGQFYHDDSSGEILFKKFGCPGEYVFDCFTSSPLVPKKENVIQANAALLSDDWKHDGDAYFNHDKVHPSDDQIVQDANIYETGEANKWRTWKSFVYREELNKDETIENYANYNRGRFLLSMFDWKNTENNDPDKWVRTSTINSYSSNGEPLEEENILNIKSTARFGYNQTQMIFVAQNADENTASYESFENLYGNQEFEYGLDYNQSYGIRSSEQVHTGNWAIKLQNLGGENNAFLMSEVQLSSQSLGEGLMVRVWLKLDKEKQDLITEDEQLLRLYFRHEGTSWNENSQSQFTKVSDAGEWSLYEAFITDFTTYSVGDIMQFGLHIQDWDTYYDTGDIYLDDVRVQPLQSEMTCYVYDRAQRITAVLDDQHYALIYQYNYEGALVRKLKETNRGVKTISETQYNSKGEEW